MHIVAVRLTTFCVLLFCICGNVYAVGERLIDAVMRSDFVFDRDISNVPFFPLGYLNVSHQSSIEIGNETGECQFDSCEFQYQSASQGLGLPFWVGKKNMFILGESLESDRLSSHGDSIQVNSAGLLGAWVIQPSEQWQAGSFAYIYSGFGDNNLATDPTGSVLGAVARYRHKETFHSYWGLIHYNANGDSQLYPYAGFDWYIGKAWSVSAVFPWPTVSYAPSKSRIYKLGATYSSTDWSMSDNGQVQNNGFQKWDVGFAVEQKLSGVIWGAVSFGALCHLATLGLAS